MSRRNLTCIGLLVVFVVFIISLVVKIKKGDPVFKFATCISGNNLQNKLRRNKVFER